MPFTLHDILLTFGIPAGISLVLMLIAWRPWSASPAKGSWAGVLAVGGAVVVGLLTIDTVKWQWPGFPPHEAVDWLFFAGIAVAIVGLLDGLLTLWPELRALLVQLLATAVAYLVLQPIIQNRWTGEQAVLRIAGFAAAAVAGWFVIERTSDRRPDALPPLILTMSAGGLAAYMMLSGSVTYGERAGVIAAALGPIVLIALWCRRLSLSRGAAMAFVILFGGLLAACAVYPVSPVAWRLITLAAAPLVGLGALWIPLRGWKSAALSIGLTLIALAVVMIPALIEFKKAQESLTPW